jgi:hypothetical protein
MGLWVVAERLIWGMQWGIAMGDLSVAAGDEARFFLKRAEFTFESSQSYVLRDVAFLES